MMKNDEDYYLWLEQTLFQLNNKEIEFYLRSKTLYNYLLIHLDTVYLKARRQAIQKTGLNPNIFPKQCSFTF